MHRYNENERRKKGNPRAEITYMTYVCATQAHFLLSFVVSNSWMDGMNGMEWMNIFMSMKSEPRA